MVYNSIVNILLLKFIFGSGWFVESMYVLNRISYNIKIWSNLLVLLCVYGFNIWYFNLWIYE